MALTPTTTWITPVDESFSILQDTTQTFTTDDLLGDDKGLNGSVLSLGTVNQPGHGSVERQASGEFVYKPNAGFVGSDSFTYFVRDQYGNSVTETVRVTVESAKVSPVLDPVITAIMDDVGASLGLVASGGSTDDTVPLLKGSGEPGTKVDIYDGRTKIGTALVGMDWQWSFTPTTALAAGTHEFTLVGMRADGSGTRTGSTAYTCVIGSGSGGNTAPVLDPVITDVVDDVGASVGTVPRGGSTDDTLPLLKGTGEPGTKVTLYDGATLIGSATVGADWHWSLPVTTALSAGTHTFTIVGSRLDGSGVTTGSTDYTVSIGGGTPNPNPVLDPVITDVVDDVGATVGTVDRGGSTDDTRPLLKGTGEPGTVVDIHDNGTKIGTASVGADWRWSFTPTMPLTTGPHEFTLVGMRPDGSGLRPGSTPYTCTIGTAVAPVFTPIITAAVDDIGPVRGPFNKGGTTDDTQPALQGTGEPNTIIVIYDNGMKIGTAPVGADWLWTFTPSTPLGAGLHDFTIVGMRQDGTGVTNGAMPYPITVAQPATPPAAPTVVIAEDTNNDGTITLAELSSKIDVQVALPTTAKAGDTLIVTDQVGNRVTHVLTTAEDASNSVSLPDAFSVPVNGQAITVSGTLTSAESGLTSVANTDSAKMNTTPVVSPVLPPAVTNALDDVGASPAYIASGGSTDDSQPQLQGTGEPGTKVDIYDNGVKFGTAQIGTNGLWSFTPATALPVGSHTFTVVGMRPDGTGASSGGSPFPITVVQPATAPAAPTVVITEDANNDGTITLAELSGKINVQVALPGTAKAGDTLTVTDQAGNKISHVVTTAEDTADRVSLPDALPVPTNGQVITVGAVLTDSASGLTSTSGTDSAKMNTTPVISPVLPPTVSNAVDNVGATQGFIINGSSTDDNQPLLQGTGEPNTVVDIYDNGVKIGTASVGANWRWSFTPDNPLAPGNHTLTLIGSHPDGSGATPSDRGYSMVVESAQPLNTASIGDHVWLDVNGNGLQDAGEAGVSGVAVQLKDSSGAVIATQTTDESGDYLFDHLAAGNYSLNLVKPVGYDLTSQNANSDAADGVDSDFNAAGNSDVIGLSAGEAVRSVDAGLRATNTNHAPVAQSDQAEGYVGNSIVVDALRNDTDQDGDALSASIKSNAAHGVVTQNASGTFSYTANNGYVGADSFTYEASDGKGGVAVATVNLTVKTKDQVTATLVGGHSVSEGSSQNYNVQLNHALDHDTYYTVNVADGSAHWVNGSTSGVDRQDIMWGGYYTVGFTGFTFYNVYNSVPLSSTRNGPGVDRPMVGPKDASWDFSTYLNGQVAGNVMVVKVAAGQTSSDTITVKAWQEKVTTDGIIHSNSDGVENNESFSLNISNVSGATSFEVINVVNKTVAIADTSSINRISPIALDMNRDGHIGVTGETTSAEKTGITAIGHTVSFDLDADGVKEQIEWMDGLGDGLLVDLTRIGAHGEIDGHALFGDMGGQFANGFEKLALRDGSHDGVISGLELQGLGVWIDNGDAVIQHGEVKAASDVGITSLSIGMQMVHDSEGRVLMQASAEVEGRTMLTEDVWFAQAGAGTALPSMEGLISHEHALDRLLGGSEAPRHLVAATTQDADLGGRDVLRHEYAALTSPSHHEAHYA